MKGTTVIAYRHLTFLGLSLVLLLVCRAAAAAPVTTTYGPFSVNCTAGVQLCNNTFSQTVTTTGLLQVQYNASAGHCSNVRAHILVDGAERAVTAFLTPGQSSGFFDVGPVGAGSHTVALQGEGTVGGCNAGLLANWGGTMDVTTDPGSGFIATNVPTLSPGMVVLLALLVAGAAAVIRRA